MKENDAFEARLQTLPPRTLPAQWREEILAGAASKIRPRASVDGFTRFDCIISSLAISTQSGQFEHRLIADSFPIAHAQPF